MIHDEEQSYLGIASCGDDSRFNRVVSARWIARETLTRMIDVAAGIDRGLP